MSERMTPKNVLRPLWEVIVDSYLLLEKIGVKQNYSYALHCDNIRVEIILRKRC